MILLFLWLLLIIGIALTDLLTFGPLNLLHLLQIPQWLVWLSIGGAIAWLIGND